MRRHVVIAIVAACVAALFVAPGVASAAPPAGPAQVWAAQEAMNLAVTWAPPVDSTGVTGYRVTTSPATATTDVPVGTERAVLSGVHVGSGYTVHVASLAGATPSAPTDAPTLVTIEPLGGSLHAIAPVRLTDTRMGLPVSGPTNSITVPIIGASGLPTSGIGSAVLNVTVTAPAGPGYLTAYPTGTTRPTASNLNYAKGQTVAGLVVVPVGSNGSITLYSQAKAQIVVDAAGWFSTSDTSSSADLFHGLTPARLMDTRSGLGATTPQPGATIDLKVTGVGGVPAAGVGAVVLNLTSAGSSGAGYVTAYPTGVTRPLASTLNFGAGQVVANRVIVPVGTDGKVSFYNVGGRTPLIADVTGWFGDGTNPDAGGAYFVGIKPTRVADYRTAGGPNSLLMPGETRAVSIAGEEWIPTAADSTPPTGVIATLTAIPLGAGGFLTAYPSDGPRPTASDVNFSAEGIVANLVVGRLGADGGLKVFNSAGLTSVVVDVFGYFVGDGSLTSAHLQQTASGAWAGAVAADGSGHLWAVAAARFGATNGHGREWATVQRWNGSAWSATLLPEPAGAKGSRVTSVAVVGPTDVWVGGSYWTDPYGGSKQTLIEHWDGTAWHLSAAPIGSTGENTGIRGLVALASDNVWAVGAERSGSRDRGLVEHWDGASWTQVAAPDATAYYFAATADHQGGIVATGEATNGAFAVTVLGSSGQAMPAPPFGAGDPLWLFGVDMLSATDGWAVGDLGSTAYHWTGTQWQRTNLATTTGTQMRLHVVSGTSGTDVWSVGMAPSGSTYHGLIEHWNGTAWSIVPGIHPGDSSSLNGLVAIGPADVWALGGSTTGSATKAFAEHWNGTTWTSVPMPLPTLVR